MTDKTEKIPQKAPQTDYLAVANEWHRRGFYTTPVKPMAKHPRLDRWNVHPAKSVSEIKQHAFDYPGDDVGLVSRKGVGKVFWLDIDHSSVEAEIFKETGQKLPRTLTTSSRPKSAPWKKHLCFRQTAYSVSQWRTEMTGIRDFTLIENPQGETVYDRVPNLFDVKGVGGGGFVVAAGCVRQIEHPKDSGKFITEKYTITDDVPIIDVPAWLVDWLLARYRRFRRDEMVAKAAEADLQRTLKDSLAHANAEVKTLLFEDDPSKPFLSIDLKRGECVPQTYRNGFLKSIAGGTCIPGNSKGDS
jgi:hypothetical protein